MHEQEELPDSMKWRGLSRNRPIEDLLSLYAHVRKPQHALWQAISPWKRQLEGAEIILVKGEGYVIDLLGSGTGAFNVSKRVMVVPDPVRLK